MGAPKLHTASSTSIRIDTDGLPRKPPPSQPKLLMMLSWTPLLENRAFQIRATPTLMAISEGM